MPDAALTIWLRRRLHAEFDPVLAEPAPVELARLIERLAAGKPEA